jgi:hypothetical protein
MAQKRILLLGLDPALVNFSPTRGLNADTVKAAGNDASARLSEMGYEVHQCLLDPATSDESAALTALSQNTFDCIMIGAGLRAVPEHTVLFERVINAIHLHAPSAKLCFNTHPSDTVDAVLRWL